MTTSPWTPVLAGRGPELAGFRTITAALADLRMLEDEEVVVSPVPRTPWTPAAEEALARWAGAVGYHRLWLPGRVVELDDELPALGSAEVHCPTCGARWEDGCVAFWERVRAVGFFPTSCLACGGWLPQWSTTPMPEDPATTHRDPRALEPHA